MPWSNDHSPSRGPASGRTTRTTPYTKKQCGCEPQKSAGFEDLEWGHVPEIQMLSQSLVEHGVWPDTKEMGMIDCFSLRLIKDWDPKLLAPGLGIQRPSSSFLSSNVAWKAFKEQKPSRENWSRLFNLAPWQGCNNSAQGKDT